MFERVAVSATVSDLVAVCEVLWPSSGAEDWDNTGLQVGYLNRPLTRVLLAVDVVADVVAEAIDGGYDAIIAHHPLILSGIDSVAETEYKGNLIAQLIRADIALLCMHTNADVVPNGVSDVLAQTLQLKDVLPIHPTAGVDIGIGRYGVLPVPTSLGRLAHLLAEILPATVPGIQVSGDFNAEVHSVALCGGAGDSLLQSQFVQEADVFISSDLRHHRASEARERAGLRGGPFLINVSHWASEWLWLTPASRQLAQHLSSVRFVVSDIRTDPWDFVVTQ